MRQLWKQFRWWFLSRQRNSFPWLFLSQQGLCALTNPCVSSGNSFGDDFLVGNETVFLDYFLVNRGYVLWRIHASALEIVSVMNSVSVETQVSLTILESTVSRMITVPAATKFSLSISESTGVVCDDESICHLWKQFRWWFLSRQLLRFPWLFVSQHGLCAMTNPCVSSGTSFGDDFLVGCDSVFLGCFWVNRGCVRCRIHESSVEAVSVTISESAAI